MVARGEVLLTEMERDELAATITRAERFTSGEIFCVVARRSDDYFHAAALSLAVGVLVAGLLLSWYVETAWLRLPLTVYAGAQTTALALALLAIWIFPQLRLRLSSGRIQARRAHENAVRQFLAHDIRKTGERTGVLIFVSMAERYAEILADEAVAARVPQAEWNRILADLLDEIRAERLAAGLSASIGAGGKLLAEHFPPHGDRQNQLANHVVLL